MVWRDVSVILVILVVGLQSRFVPGLSKNETATKSSRAFASPIPTVVLQFDQTLDLMTGRLFIASFPTHSSVVWSVDCSNHEIQLICQGPSCHVRFFYFDGNDDLVSLSSYATPTYVSSFDSGHILIGSFDENSNNFLDPLTGTPHTPTFTDGEAKTLACGGADTCVVGASKDFFPQTVYWSQSDTVFQTASITDGSTCGTIFRNDPVGYDLSYSGNGLSGTKDIAIPACTLDFFNDADDLSSLCPPPPTGSVHMTNTQVSKGHLENADTSNLPSNNDFTVEAWVKTSFDMEGEHQSFFSHGNNDQGVTIGFTTIAYETRLALVMKQESPYEFRDFYSNSGVSYNDDQWYHVAVVRDWTNDDVVLYIDGVSVPVMASATALVDVSSLEPLRIGSSGHGAPYNGGPYAGWIDELRVWDHSRSAAQIQALMDQSCVGDEAGLVRCYKFDEDSRDSFTDSVTGGLLSVSGVAENINVDRIVKKL
mmetsp:Transcript_5257/g.6700  ORF Transcript_5257/g.6700 Transcript_5257/m.6700 type:complete len:481 (+) Transcript_5257:114-1556(+)